MAAQIGAPAAAARSHEQLFAYWASRRQGAKLPSRRDLHPGDIKRLLPTLSLIDVVRDPLDFRVRLAGTGLYDASHLSILWLRLPLASDGFEVDMILGYDAVVGLGQVTTGVRAA
jgi:hypothetical protein